MKFDLHTTIRWGDGPKVDQAYLPAIIAYYRHLAHLDFSAAKPLLRYFGDSFFHDAEVRHARLDVRSGTVELSLFTENDLEDINAYRQSKHLPAVPRYQYRKNPIVYVCQFTGVAALRGHTPRLQARRSRVWIMDTELDRTNGGKGYLVRMTFAQDREIEFACRTCSVLVKDRRKIAAYTGGLRKDLPRCVACRSTLLSPAKILRVLKEAEDRFQAQAQQPHAADARSGTRVVRPGTARG